VITTTWHAPDARKPPERGRIGRTEWLLLGVTTFLSLAALELVLRLWFPLYASPYQPDDVVLVRLAPGARKVFTRFAINGGQRIISQINSQGFRGEELRPADHLRRVIVYGDSNVQAEFSELADTFPRQLEKRLEPRLGAPVEVVNAGVVGYGPDQVSMRLPGELARLKPALVVVVVFADNDFGDLIRNRIYGLNARGDLELNRYQLAPEMRARLQRASHPRGLARLQLARYASRLLQLIRVRRIGQSSTGKAGWLSEYFDYSLARSQSDFRDYMADTEVHIAADPFEDPYDADIAVHPDWPSSRYKAALMEKVLVRLRDTVATRSVPLLLVILPAAIDACDHYELQVNSREYPQYDRTRLSALVEQIAARNGILHLNLWDAFHGDGVCYYFHGGDNHWNDAGQAKAAQLLSDLIVRRGLLAGPTPP
jgi:hypothetical protein